MSTKPSAAVIAGALFDFAAYLSTREESFEVGAQHHPGPIIDALKAWAVERELSLDDAAVESWSWFVAADTAAPTTDGIEERLDRIISLLHGISIGGAGGFGR